MKGMKIMKENLRTPVSAAALKHFAFGDQSRACGTVGSRPASRRWQVTGNNVLFAVPRLRDGQFLLTFVNAKAWA